MKRIVSLDASKDRRPWLLRPLWILTLVILAAFGVLLLVGFENVLALLRYRVTLFLLMAPVLGLFIWCVYKAFQSGKKP